MNTAVDRSLLKSAFPFPGCNAAGALLPEVPADLERCTTVARYRQHQTIYFEGDSADAICQVVEGCVMLYKLLPDGRRQVVELLGQGDVFGFARGEERDCSAETLTDVRVRFIDRRSAERSCSFQRILARRMLIQFEAMHEHAVLLGRKSAMERVASFLLRLAPDTDQPVISLPMTRQEIADYLGLTIETVSRSFSELKRRGLIVLEKQDRVRITRFNAIEDLATAC
ncbi:helix-turn-helix domain-containing protein [Microbaculum marinum]|uniref:Helix-turn-helix domain-containing protein n=1 Tax=Microbaculum marinum TaxID=1764581 RepID=A0AAW9RTW8_9HYPH